MIFAAKRFQRRAWSCASSSSRTFWTWSNSPWVSSRQIHARSNSLKSSGGSPVSSSLQEPFRKERKIRYRTLCGRKIVRFSWRRFWSSSLHFSSKYSVTSCSHWRHSGSRSREIPSFSAAAANANNRQGRRSAPLWAWEQAYRNSSRAGCGGSSAAPGR